MIQMEHIRTLPNDAEAEVASLRTELAEASAIEAELAALKAKQSKLINHATVPAEFVEQCRELATVLRNVRHGASIDTLIRRFRISVERLFPEPERKPMENIGEVLKAKLDADPAVTEAIAIGKLRSEVPVSPIRCRCGGVGVVLHSAGSAFPWRVVCHKCTRGHFTHCASKEDAISDWSKKNAPPEPPKEPELLPCPFCGGTDLLFRGFENEGNRRVIVEDKSLAQFVCCRNCRSEGPCGPNRIEAIKRHNCRYPEKQN